MPSCGRPLIAVIVLSIVGLIVIPAAAQESGTPDAKAARNSTDRLHQFHRADAAEYQLYRGADRSDLLALHETPV